jgi:mannose-6-phosphate isomerase class I
MDRQVPQDEGWPLLAQLMAKRPDFEAFSRFRDLNVKNLLYYQVQLEMLRQDLKEQEQRECRHVETAKYADTSMIDNAKSRQWQRIEKLRRLLREYSKRLLIVNYSFYRIGTLIILIDIFLV